MIPAHLINWPPPGRYILAVSGGADSMALLHLFASAAPVPRGQTRTRDYELVVAHFDHGLRPDSAADRQLVQAAAARHGLPFAHHEARLGRASEAAARAARYAWLEQTRAGRKAAAIITAHHQDDLLETSLLNLARGSGRRGLAPMQPAPDPTAGAILRPLLGLTRADLRAYARTHHLTWHEDSTNSDLTNPRNYLRHHLLAKATPAWRAQYHKLITRLAALNTNIEPSLASILALHAAPGSYAFPRSLIRDLSLPELEELIVAAAHRLQPDIEPGQRLTREVALFAKTASPHRTRPLHTNLQIVIKKDLITLQTAKLAGKP
jgi:tRNA(Ile)-lysidine synthetase-like protein